MEENTTLPCSKEQLLQFRNQAVLQHFAKKHQDLGLSSAEIEAIFEDLMKMLYITALSEEKLAPTPLVQQMWMVFFIFPEDYRDFCQAYFGKFIEYIPYEKPVTAETLAYTQTLLQKHFPAKLAQEYCMEEQKEKRPVLNTIIVIATIVISIVFLYFFGQTATIPLDLELRQTIAYQENCATHTVKLNNERTFYNHELKSETIKMQTNSGRMEVALRKTLKSGDEGDNDHYDIDFYVFDFYSKINLKSIEFVNIKDEAIVIKISAKPQHEAMFHVAVNEKALWYFIKNKPKYIALIDDSNAVYRFDIPEKEAAEMETTFKCTFLSQREDKAINPVMIPSNRYDDIDFR